MKSYTGFKLLAVDDNEHNLFTLRALVEKHMDVEILEARGGVEALEIAQAQLARLTTPPKETDIAAAHDQIPFGRTHQVAVDQGLEGACTVDAGQGAQVAVGLVDQRAALAQHVGAAKQAAQVEGRVAAGIGAEVSFTFGERRGQLLVGADTIPLEYQHLGLAGGDLVDPAHQFQVIFTGGTRFIIQTAPANPKQIGLTGKA